MACEKGDGCTCVGNKVKPTCKYWIPSRKSKYYFCARYIANRITCDLPTSSCPTCPHYEGGAEPGRPNFSGIDWDNPLEVAEYHRRYKENRRAKNEQKSADTTEKRAEK